MNLGQAASALAPSHGAVVCFSHLAFAETLFQRPQHIMTGLAARGHAVLFLAGIGFAGTRRLRETGMPVDGKHPRGGEQSVHFVNHYYSPFSRFAPLLTPFFRRTAAKNLHRAAGTPVVAYLYHPAFLPEALSLAPDRIVYDVMDRFPDFRTRTNNSNETERRLLERADVVIAGGRSLQQAIESEYTAIGLNRIIHCIPSGVDTAHFARALSPGTMVPRDFAQLPRPIFGYMGAIDERIDFDCVTRLATDHPGATVLLVGPVLSAPADLPPNVRLTGPRPYSDLPQVLRAFDVALIPYHLTGPAAFASPTKTPEYLAAGKPVVSTPVADVVTDYGDIVAIAGSPQEFSRACDAVLANPPPAATLSAEAWRRASSWDAIADRISSLVSR